jgi:hypothetical protein
VHLHEPHLTNAGIASYYTTLFPYTIFVITSQHNHQTSLCRSSGLFLVTVPAAQGFIIFQTFHRHFTLVLSLALF